MQLHAGFLSLFTIKHILNPDHTAVCEKICAVSDWSSLTGLLIVSGICKKWDPDANERTIVVYLQDIDWKQQGEWISPNRGAGQHNMGKRDDQ